MLFPTAIDTVASSVPLLGLLFVLFRRWFGTIGIGGCSPTAGVFAPSVFTFTSRTITGRTLAYRCVVTVPDHVCERGP
jgi:hypothetical protein